MEKREFFDASGRYFFAEVLETVQGWSGKTHFKIRKDDGTEMMAYPSMGHMKAISIENWQSMYNAWEMPEEEEHD